MGRYLVKLKDLLPSQRNFCRRMDSDKFTKPPQVDWTVEDIVWREATLSDLDFVTKYNMGLAVETEDKTCDWDEVLQTTKHIVENWKLGVYYVSYIKGHEHFPIASNMLCWEYNIRENRECYWHMSVYVHKDFRGQGVFKNIYKQTLDLARNRGYNKVKLYVETDNAPAIATYKKLGMSILENDVVYEFDSVFAFGSTVVSHAARQDNIKKNLAMMDEYSSMD